MDVGDRGVGVDTAGPEACNSGRAQVRSVESARSTWAPAFDPELEAALDEALAHVPIETPVAARRAGAGRPGASRSPDDDPGTSAGDPTRCLGPLADLPPRPPAPGGEAGGPAHPARGHPSSFGRKDDVEIRGPASLRLDHRQSQLFRNPARPILAGAPVGLEWFAVHLDQAITHLEPTLRTGPLVPQIGVDVTSGYLE